MKNYVVEKDFTDQNGRAWRKGEPFEGDDDAIQHAGANIREGQAQQGQGGQSQQGQSGQQGQRHPTGGKS